ncbi:MAG: response regulator [Anaerolineae bacterium]|jgi:CheY-like chemotaxis protein
MSHKILVVDRNQAFATMLERMLEADGGYEVQVAPSGSDALALLGRTDFDLTIVDMDLDAEDMGYHDLIVSVRQSEPAMRLVLIPLMGSDLPPEALQMDIQGVLSKPFFAEDLLPDIRAALSRQVSLRPPPPVEPPPPMPAQQAAPDVQPALSELARELNAQAALLLSTAGDDVQVLAHVSTLASSKVDRLADLGMVIVRSAQATAQFLGQPDGPFEHHMFESDSLKLYMMVLRDDQLLLVVTPHTTRLGTIRHNLRRAARALTTHSWP